MKLREEEQNAFFRQTYHTPRPICIDQGVVSMQPMPVSFLIHAPSPLEKTPLYVHQSPHIHSILFFLSPGSCGGIVGSSLLLHPTSSILAKPYDMVVPQQPSTIFTREGGSSPPFVHREITRKATHLPTYRHPSPPLPRPPYVHPTGREREEIYRQKGEQGRTRTR